jgi:ATP-binding cassette subfamily C protein
MLLDASPKTTARLVWQLLELLVASTGTKVFLVVALMLAVGAMEGVGLCLLVPLMQIAGFEVAGGGIGRVAESIGAVFAAIGVRPTLVAVLGIYVAVACATALLSRIQGLVAASLHQEFTHVLRCRLYRAVTHSGWLFIMRNRSSDFVYKVTSEVERATFAVRSLVNMTVSGIITVVYVALAFQLSPTMTTLVFVCGLALLITGQREMRAAKRLGKAVSEAHSDLYAAAIEQLGSIKAIKSFGAEDRTIEIFGQLSRGVVETEASSARGYGRVGLIHSIGQVLILGGLVWVAFEVLEMPVASLVLVMFLVNRITPRLTTLQQHWQYVRRALPSFEAFLDMQTRSEAAVEVDAPERESISLSQGIRFEGVSFGYVEGEPPIICDVDMTIEAGRTTAIVGPSGAGKSTLADLVMGLIPPDRGRVQVDDQPLVPARLGSWREQIGYVQQETFLFHDTVRANLLWARPSATESELWNALDLAAASEFVAAMPERLDTVLGDRGVRVSGGERQRLALARALLRQPSLLILDEATSALDTENERRIQQAIEGLHGSMTILIITHRLSTIRGADTIYVIEGGRIVERGSWDMLVADETGRFRALYSAQAI